MIGAHYRAQFDQLDRERLQVVPDPTSPTGKGVVFHPNVWRRTGLSIAQAVDLEFSQVKEALRLGLAQIGV